jgi:uncharacterized damage-inducible protein DinB
MNPAEPKAQPAPANLPEPWLRGPLENVPAHLMPVFHSFAQVREDLALHTSGLTNGQVWRSTGVIPPLGFQLRHIAGSVDRLVTYLMDEPLSESQLAELKQESAPGAGLPELLAAVNQSLSNAEQRIRGIPESALHDARFVGKKRMPTTVLGLLVHLAEHTQRHLGQAITTAKLVRAEKS